MKKAYHTSISIEELLELIPDQFDKSSSSNMYALLNTFGIAIDEANRQVKGVLSETSLEESDISIPSVAYKTELSTPVLTAQGNGIDLSLAKDMGEFLFSAPHTRSAVVGSIPLPYWAYDIDYYNLHYYNREYKDCLLVSLADRILILDTATGDILNELVNTLSFITEEVNANDRLRYLPQSIRVQNAQGEEPLYTIENKQLQIDTPGEYHVAYTYRGRIDIRGVTVDEYNAIYDSSYQYVTVAQVLNETEVQELLGGDEPPSANGKWIVIVIEPAQSSNKYDVTFDGTAGTYNFNGYAATYDETNNRYYITLTYPVEGETIDEWLTFATVDIEDFAVQVSGDIRYDYLCYDDQRECFWGAIESNLYRLSFEYDVLDEYALEHQEIKGLAYRHEHLYLLDGNSYLHVYNAYSLEKVHGYQLNGVYEGLAFDAEGYMWTISHNALVKHRLYYDYYVNDVYDCFTREQYNTFVINSMEVSQESYPLWTPLDTFGLLLDVTRLPDESNVSYRERLRNVYVHPSNNTAQGVINSVSRAIGSDTNVVKTHNTVRLKETPLSYAEVMAREINPYDVSEHDEHNLLVFIDGLPIKRTTVAIRKESGNLGQVYRSVGQIFSVSDDTVLFGFHLGIVTDALAQISLIDVASEALVMHWYANGFYEMTHPDTRITLEANKEYMIVVESDGELNCAVDDAEAGLYASDDGLYNDMTERAFGLEYTLYGYKATPASIQDYAAYNVDSIVWLSGDISNRYVSVSYMTENGERAESCFIEKPDSSSDISVSSPQVGSRLPKSEKRGEACASGFACTFFQTMRTFGNSFLDDTEWIDGNVDLLNPVMADAILLRQNLPQKAPVSAKYIQSGHYADDLLTEINRDGFPKITQGSFNIRGTEYYLCGRKVTEQITPSHELDNERKGLAVVTYEIG